MQAEEVCESEISLAVAPIRQASFNTMAKWHWHGAWHGAWHGHGAVTHAMEAVCERACVGLPPILSSPIPSVTTCTPRRPQRFSRAAALGDEITDAE